MTIFIGTSVMTSYFKSSRYIWFEGRTPVDEISYLQCFGLNLGHQDGSPNNGHQGDMPY